MTARHIIAAYFPYLLLIVIVALGTYLLGDPAAVIFHKTLLAPMFLLASKGLRAYFPEHLDATRSLAVSAEYHFLNAGLLATFLTFVTNWKDSGLTTQCISFALMTLIVGGFNILMLWLGRRSRDRQGHADRG